jgi:hypothetical protein
MLSETLLYIILVVLIYILIYVSFFRYFFISNSNLLIPPIETFTFKNQPDRNYYYKIKKLDE